MLQTLQICSYQIIWMNWQTGLDLTRPQRKGQSTEIISKFILNNSINPKVKCKTKIVIEHAIQKL